MGRITRGRDSEGQGVAVERRRLGRSLRPRFVAAAALLVVTAACTTVEPVATTMRSSGPGAVAAPRAGTGADPGGPGADGSTGPEETGGGAGGPAVTNVDDPGGGGGFDLSGCPLGRPLKLGVSYSSDLAAGLAVVGQPEAAATAVNYTDTLEATYRAIAESVNAEGGIGGCSVELVFFDFSSLAADGFDGQSQRECAYFAEDQRVFTAFSNALETNVLVECLAQNDVVSFYGGAEYAPTQRDFDRYRGHLYQPWAINTDRWASFIDIWNDAGFFGVGARVGILIADDGTGNGQRLAYDVWQPRLEQLGIEVASTFEYSWIRSYATVADASTALSAAVLKFKADGVTHVLPTPDGSAMSIFMTSQAESQDYRPAYGTTTASGGPPLTSPDGQTHNWMTIAWDDAILLQSPTQGPPTDGNPPNAAQAACDAVAATVVPGYNAARRWCDTLYFLRDALRGATEITSAALLAGAEALGSGYQVAAGFGGSSFGPGRYDGAAQVRAARYDPDAGSFHYVTPVVAVP